MALPELLINGPDIATQTIVLAHGAGAPMDSPFMETFAQGLAKHDFRVVRFEFPYMHYRRQQGGKKPPDRAPILMATWAAVINHLGCKNLIIGGKSMGGRYASMAAEVAERDGHPVAGIIALGYPFHPPGKPEKTRTDHLKNLKTPMLICQGTRDTLGTRDDIMSYALPPHFQFNWLEDGDHSFKPRKKSGFTETENWHQAIQAIIKFCHDINYSRTSP